MENVLHKEQPRRPPRPALVGLAGGLLVGALFVAGCGALGKKTVDCINSPGGTVDIIIDTAKEGRDQSIGDATMQDGSINWRDEVQVNSRGDGEFGVTSYDFGPIITYDGLVARGGHEQVFKDTQTGSQVVADAIPNTKKVRVTFVCAGG